MADNVSKMRIVAFSNPERKGEGVSMDVQVNPETFNQKYEINYNKDQAQGTSGKLPEFNKIKPQKMEFELLFDRTGVINGAVAGENGIQDDLDELRNLVITYDGDKHKPNYASVYWGTLKFDGSVETIDINYKLFNSSGAPLRAVVRISFVGIIDDKKRVARENASSPDLTHVRVVNEGDTLPLLCYQIYGDPKYYIEVAKVNKLRNFRYLTKGMKIKFPPLTK